MQGDKLKAYLGFAIKSNKVLFGYDKLFDCKKIPNLVIICSTLNEKNTNKVIEFCNNHNIQNIKLSNIILGELVSRNNCKVIAICDDNFSKVICNELDLLNGKQ